MERDSIPLPLEYMLRDSDDTGGRYHVLEYHYHKIEYGSIILSRCLAKHITAEITTDALDIDLPSNL